MGHARVYIIWDVIQRYLRFKGYDVIYARNVTDVDDKIINKAKALGVSPEAVARKFLYEFWRDMEALNIQPPDSEPRATEYISQMIEFIEGLIAKGHAYVADNDVYFDVASLGSSYGQLSKQDFAERMVGAREQATAQDVWKSVKKIRMILLFGKAMMQKMIRGIIRALGLISNGNIVGIVPGELGVLVGILNAQLWLNMCLVKQLICTAAAKTYNFPITKMS